MPTYGYECTACKDQFEIFQSIKADALTTCEKCGSNLRKLIYPVGIAFKGSGFYVNDYAAKPSGSTTGTSKTSESSSDGSAKPEASTATETKAAPETKATPSSTPAAA